MLLTPPPSQTCQTHPPTKPQLPLAPISSCGYEEWQAFLRSSLRQTASAARILILPFGPLSRVSESIPVLGERSFTLLFKAPDAHTLHAHFEQTVCDLCPILLGQRSQTVWWRPSPWRKSCRN
ncbi:hypothetical protein M405DRAFT_384406 [Rhizopogon salebrosus TDB-379]|nr:hypothetical protein M405DRAFT_384406 [Rhizopogon salebrosus TDB-379]